MKAPYSCDILNPLQADVAQQVEQLTRNEQVSGSSPLVGSLVFLGLQVNHAEKAVIDAERIRNIDPPWPLVLLFDYILKNGKREYVS